MSNSSLLNVHQLAEFLNCSVGTVQGFTRARSRRSKEPVIPHLFIGRKVYFRQESVEAWLKAKEVR